MLPLDCERLFRSTVDEHTNSNRRICLNECRIVVDNGLILRIEFENGTMTPTMPPIDYFRLLQMMGQQKLQVAVWNPSENV